MSYVDAAVCSSTHEASEIVPPIVWEVGVIPRSANDLQHEDAVAVHAGFPREVATHRVLQGHVPAGEHLP